MRQTLSILLAGIAMSFLAVACTSGHVHVTRTPHATPSAVATAEASARADVRAFAAKCIPSAVPSQVKLGQELLTDTNNHPNGSWARLLACGGVDKSNEQDIRTRGIAAAERVNWLDKTARDRYFEVTLFGIIQSDASVPGVSPSATAVPSHT